MGFRFRKSINLGGGFRVNVSKSGVGYSWGTKGARVTKTARGKTRKTVSIPGTGISYTSESGQQKPQRRTGATHTVPQHFDQTNNASNKYRNPNKNNERGPAMAWIDFLICLFLGIFGVHKFREKKIGMGILYLFTAGLFCIGWIYDCIRYLVIALKPQPQTRGKFEARATTSTTNFENTKNAPTPVKKIAAWIITVIFFCCAIAYIPSFAGFTSFIVAILLLPLRKVQKFFKQYLKGVSKTIILIILILLTFICAPAQEPADDNMVPSVTNASEAIEETIPTTNPIAETITETTVATTIATTEPTTEATTEPTTEPTTVPTTEATEAPTKPAAPENDYVLNTSSRKFHSPYCRHVKRMNEGNTSYYTGTRDSVIAKGYEPCGTCHP